MCQYDNPSPGDWCNLVEEDFNQIGIHMSREHITSLSPSEYKKYIKDKVQNTAFKNLDQIKATNIKVKNNYYKNMDKPQEYLTSKLFSNQQCFLIFAMKSKTLRGVKANFKNLYSDNNLCPL